MFADIPVDVGVVYEGERVRKKEMYVEFGGPNVDYKFELLRVRKPEEVEDGKINIIGPDIKDLEEGKSYRFGILIEVAGKELEELYEGVMERKIHEYCNYIQGLMHLNQRYDIWLRLSKKSFEKGFNSFVYWGKVLLRLYKSEFPIIEKMQITFITDPEKVKELHAEALKVYEARDARARGLTDEEVDVFYGCTLCQSFAPTHCCVITPQRYANCGAISWFDGRAAVKIDPKGPIFEIPKGECLDPVKGEYSGVNEAVKKKTFGAIQRVWLYTAFGHPHTSCGCFEAAAFYIPEVDGFGIVHRGFKGVTVNGLTFGQIADSTAGGRQVDGFHGISIEYMRSKKFLQADGGWSRVVWMPSELKERVKDFIPKELVDKIATEKEATNIEELKEFLKKVDHPVVKRWVEVEEAKPEEVAAAPAAAAAEGIPIILKGVRITAKRLIIRGAGAK
ncbi:CO dehydrogenase/CO-methylating acetyl-CoA synthase complex subunit beta [Candidatus Geothermarchaeota archaeon ex4572_27]|nr:MAG: CO dehydrogenase/CO-methylating acetyl-CoA synthase complex subunit beta [Candidatus Geothermarchaeota archaeon ex4572_27]